MTEPGRPSGRLKLLLVAAVFGAPLAVAAWQYYSGGSLVPQGRTNHGVLMDPVINLEDALPGADTAGISPGQWLLVYADAGACEEACREALYTTRQLRLMLGAEMERVTRVFLHGATLPDTVVLANEHAGLVALENDRLGELLDRRRPGDVAGGGYYLVDPLGNLVMYFPPTLPPRDVVEDIERLLRLSRIG